jgi:MutS domain V
MELVHKPPPIRLMAPVDRPCGKSLVIITGANSGGKSMFLRSVGQAQLMMQCGMFVTARSLRASVCRQVFTHFIREEDPDMVSGRLDEELTRMSVIADRIGPRCLILFNESFAATNEREGSEIGRQVVRALLEAGIRVFFVTPSVRLRRQLPPPAGAADAVPARTPAAGRAAHIPAHRRRAAAHQLRRGHLPPHRRLAGRARLRAVRLVPGSRRGPAFPELQHIGPPLSARLGL